MKTFLQVDTSIKMILGMFFLKLTNANIKFLVEEFIWRTYTITKAFYLAKWVELIDKYKFAKAALDKISKISVVYVFTLKTLNLAIYPFWATFLATL